MPDQPPAASLAQLHNVQVVVNSYGREKWYVERAIASMLRQKYRPVRIHFIDQNDTPLQLAPDLFADGHLVQHHQPDKNCSRTRNLARELVPTGWIAFADDDAWWADDYSGQLHAILNQRPDLQLIAGAVYDEETKKPYSFRHVLGGNLRSAFGSKLFCGANFLIRAEQFAAVGGYECRIGPGTPWASSEDADLCWRVLATQAPVLYAPELRIFHPPMHLSNIRAAARKAYAYGLGRGALCAIWIFERRHRYGLLELLEMTVVPAAKIILHIVRFDFAPVRIHAATLWGRHFGFWKFIFQHQ